ncbi:hypothetical protein [Tritonibacter mobilis]|uniref:hypothetical protein n=1 Tax=Tritonibacter mobilis TaxID=379347 RepID=UPI000806C18A|nr:hypothetical protein [Tritonibacter mobilis]
MRIAYWIPIAVLALVLAGIGFRYGIIRQGITESDVITHYAQKYLADHAVAGAAGRAKLSDCVARPAKDAGFWTWLVVTCRPDGTAQDVGFRYQVNWLGGLIDVTRLGKTPPTTPQT